ncbi:pirin family protein [Planktothricoides raciborskii]|uniref:Pirin family protein n=1 Tax=Planktothricoides raciborskii FACHB-1370 TaxID=2949576 RepID=A0ABR8EHG6_9CYAN|nr:pirin family protein [Planktothricoides raciborskii]MBD2545593.1 pirin family protein [Planktothricoides raciborskii FACHB-1370]MBD2583499.1 pirin family protein [Planktothricoides raciborskii FACHB-1261]
MLTIRKSQERGHANRGWLDSYHTFSFASYYDPNFMGFGNLRVINEDRVQPKMGFPTHSHQDMEIVTYVIEGALEHKDSMGNSSVIRPGEVQRMSAGTGVSHSEYNHSDNELVHLLQIWILPEKKGLPASYEQKMYSPAEKIGQLRLVGSRDGRDGSVTIHQDVNLYASLLAAGDKMESEIKRDSLIWLQLIKGQITVNNQAISAGDAVAMVDESTLILSAESDAEFLFFDLGR